MFIIKILCVDPVFHPLPYMPIPPCPGNRQNLQNLHFKSRYMPLSATFPLCLAIMPDLFLFYYVEWLEDTGKTPQNMPSSVDITLHCLTSCFFLGRLLLCPRLENNITLFNVTHLLLLMPLLLLLLVCGIVRIVFSDSWFGDLVVGTRS